MYFKVNHNDLEAASSAYIACEAFDNVCTFSCVVFLAEGEAALVRGEGLAQRWLTGDIFLFEPEETEEETEEQGPSSPPAVAGRAEGGREEGPGAGPEDRGRPGEGSGEGARTADAP
jgi:hypothetical protein